MADFGRILVTGGAGFIGSHTVDRLLRDGFEVAVIDDFNDYYDPELKWKNLEWARRQTGFELVQADLRDFDRVAALLRDGNFGYVVHLAARAGVRPSIAQPALYYEVNCTATAHLFEQCRLAGVERVAFASSSSVYGGNESVPFSETDSVDRPVSPYAATKKAGELLAHTYSHLYGLSVTCLRFFTVYGPRQRPEMAIHKFARLIERGEPVPRFGDGSSARDYTFVDDIVDGVVRAMKQNDGFSIYNLGNSSPVTLAELIEKLGRVVGKTPIIEPLEDQPGDVAITFADISRARDALGYKPATDIDTGLAKTVEWLRESHAQRVLSLP